MDDENTDKLVGRWRAAFPALEDAKQEVARCEVELRNATNELAKWLSPADAKPEEKIGIWVQNVMLEVAYNFASGNGTVRERLGSKR